MTKDRQCKWQRANGGIANGVVHVDNAQRTYSEHIFDTVHFAIKLDQIYTSTEHIEKPAARVPTYFSEFRFAAIFLKSNFDYVDRGGTIEAFRLLYSGPVHSTVVSLL